MNTPTGHIAFKVSYSDQNWEGICSKKNAYFNYDNRTYCNYQSQFDDGCQSDLWKGIDVSFKNGSPCMDCVALKEIAFYGGHNHSIEKDNIPKKIRYAKVGKLMVFTSLAPYEKEPQREVIAISKIQRIEEVQDPVNGAYEIVFGDKEKTIKFKEGKRPRFWSFYENPEKPEIIAWNAGLFRYIENEIIKDLLEYVVKRHNLSKAKSNICQSLISEL